MGSLLALLAERGPCVAAPGPAAAQLLVLAESLRLEESRDCFLELGCRLGGCVPSGHLTAGVGCLGIGVEAWALLGALQRGGSLPPKRGALLLCFSPRLETAPISDPLIPSKEFRGQTSGLLFREIPCVLFSQSCR